MSQQFQSLESTPPALIASSLKNVGLSLDYGACTVRIVAPHTEFETSLKTVYGAFDFIENPEFSDFHINLQRGSKIRRYIRPTVHFQIDGIRPFDPFPLSNALPLYEWGINWCFAQRFNQYILLHAGTLAQGNKGIVMAAVPGSGKSTLSAAMMLRGFRLLSDEFGVLDPATGGLLPMLKPIALKNQSIDIIRFFSDCASLGPTFVGTKKGDVAHLGPDRPSVIARHQAATPALIIFPRYEDGAKLTLTLQSPDLAFSRLAFNSFNYALLGPISFTAVAALAARCPAYELRYSQLDEAVNCLRDLVANTHTNDV